jgi:pyruvate dehydrogenase E2 component (dihydrolipoamide acetyltransferase)
MLTVIMPQVGQDIPSAEIIEWRKAEGERVEKGEVVVVVESEKAAFEVEADGAGVVRKILHEEGEEVEILAPLAYIGEPDEPLPAAEESRPERPAAATEPPEEPARAGEPKEAAHAAASPSARRLARQRGIDLAGVEGSGPGGRIVKRDVLAAVAEAGGREVPFGKMRRRIAERLTASARDIPHFYLSAEADVTDVQAWRRERNAGGDLHLTVTDLVIKAAADALREFERLNAHVAEDRLIVKPDVNVGVAVAAEEGLLVPVIAEADRKSLEEVSRLSRQHAEAARRGVLRSGAEGTFTVSSLGMWGVTQFLPIINPPECAILAVAAARQRVVPTGGGVGVREMMPLTLGCDHRAVDGAYAARFLQNVSDRLGRLHETEAVNDEGTHIRL